ncbi:MAG: apolipoprotein N-acyltransferase [Ignavibacteriaceae bacterium]|nr:apolipoprotein N-acyltransferase [Ignavibacteriaceae bacterium]
MTENNVINAGEEDKSKRKARIRLVLSGVLFGLAFSPVPFPFTLFFFLYPFLTVIEKEEKGREIYKSFYLMMLSASFVLVYWVGAFTEMKDHFLMISGVVLFFFNAMYLCFQALLYIPVRKRFGSRTAILLLPVFWSVNDLFYMWGDFSFPWISAGHAASNFNSFIQIADIIGSPGIGLLVLYINVFFYFAVKKFREGGGYANRFSWATGVLIIIPLLYSAFPLPQSSGKTLSVGLIQPDLDPYDKWAGDNLDAIMEDYFSLSDQAIQGGAEMLVWPETALPAYIFSGAYPAEAQKIYDYVERTQIPLLTGMPDLVYYGKENAPPHSKFNEQMDYYYRTHNAAFLIQPGGKPVQRYGKMKLVPFGEKIPLADKIPVIGKFIKWGVGISGWNEGIDTTILTVTRESESGKELLADSVSITPLICYESVYPVHTAEFSKRGANLIAVVTNDSWYGNTSGPYQHRDFAKLRAVENRLPVIRAANGGISCLINSRGELKASLSMYTRDYLVVDAELGAGGTIYNRYAEVIPWMLWIIAISAVLMSFFSRKKTEL